MRLVAPVSGDLLVKLALVGVAGFLVWRAVQGARAGLGTVFVDAQWFNPASDKNVVYQGANAVLSKAVGYEETVGGWLHDITHQDPVNPVFRPDLGTVGDVTYDAMGNVISIQPPVNTGGATGSW